MRKCLQVFVIAVALGALAGVGTALAADIPPDPTEVTSSGDDLQLDDESSGLPVHVGPTVTVNPADENAEQIPNDEPVTDWGSEPTEDRAADVTDRMGPQQGPALAPGEKTPPRPGLLKFEALVEGIKADPVGVIGGGITSGFISAGAQFDATATRAYNYCNANPVVCAVPIAVGIVAILAPKPIPVL